MAILTDTFGLILHSLGDGDFLTQASKVALQPGALWSEVSRGTNAIGTALAEAKPTLVHGSEHYLQANQFLTCPCVPIFDPYGVIVDALDVTGDHRGSREYTMALVCMSAQTIENHLSANTFQDVVCIHFHSCPEFISTLVEGTVASTSAGCFLSANYSNEFQLGPSIRALYTHTFPSLLGLSMSQLIDRERAAAAGIVQLRLPSGVKVFARVKWERSANRMVGGAIDADLSTDRDAALCRVYIEPIRQPASLEALGTGDAQIQTVIGKLRKVIGKDILVMVLGEAGMGKELPVRAIHADSLRHVGSSIAVNCTLIPEALIESELFGYEEDTFTGARKKGGIGRVALANGDTLFLDEIGDMPPHLQARLLRALQERAAPLLGSNKLIQVDATAVCATHRNMCEMVASGQFREDLYYWLNGLVVRPPALRERSDLDVVTDKLLKPEQADAPPISEVVTQTSRSYCWLDNTRQLGNLLRTARLMAEGAPEITEDRLSDDFPGDWRVRHGDQSSPGNTVAPAVAVPLVTQNTGGTQPKQLVDVESTTIMAAVQAHDGNISAAVKAPGISRNIIYRRIDEAGGLPSDID